jgi:hypothetical protein
VSGSTCLGDRAHGGVLVWTESRQRSRDDGLLELGMIGSSRMGASMVWVRVRPEPDEKA